MGSTATWQITPPRRSRQRPDRCSIPSQMRSISSHSCIKSSQIRTKTSQAPDRKRNKMEQFGTVFRGQGPPVDGQRKCPGLSGQRKCHLNCSRWYQGSHYRFDRLDVSLADSQPPCTFFAVSRWMASSRATLRIDRPLRFAFCTAFHLSRLKRSGLPAWRGGVPFELRQGRCRRYGRRRVPPG